MADYILNDHNKEEFPPAHTAEHLLNQTMQRLFGCERSYNAHIERKKSKMSFHLDQKPSRQEEKEIERRMNELIEEEDWPFRDAWHQLGRTRALLPCPLQDRIGSYLHLTDASYARAVLFNLFGMACLYV